MHKLVLRVLLSVVMIIIFAVPNSFAAPTYNIYLNKATFKTAADPLTLQDFEGYASSVSIAGANILPSVTVTSNMSRIEVWRESYAWYVGGPNQKVFAYDQPPTANTRSRGTAYYEIDLNSAYKAVGFDILDWELGGSSGGSGKGQIGIFFGGTEYKIDLSQTSNGGVVFFGVTADTAIEKIRFYEDHELSGGNEETTLDNIMAGRAVATPVPGALFLFGPCLAGIIGRRICKR